MAADFKLLEAYVQLKVSPTLSAFQGLLAQYEQAIKKVTGKTYNFKLGLSGAGGKGTSAGAAGMRETSAEAARFSDLLNRAKLSFLEIRRSAAPLTEKMRSLAQLDDYILKVKKNENLTLAQQVRLIEVATKATEKRMAIENRLSKEARMRTAAITQSLNRMSLEAGFLFGPKTQALGNFVRLGSAMKQLTGALGAGSAASTVMGVAFAGILTVVKGLAIAFSILVRILTTVATVAFRTFISAMRLAFAPTLAFLRLVQQVVSNLPLLAVALGGLVTKRLIEYGKQLERINNTFRLAFGRDAGKQFDFVRSTAAALGLPLQDIADQYSRIAFAASAAGISQRDLKQLFEGVGQASIALGLDAERVSGVFFALEQVISKGTLSSEELRRQLGDRLPGAFQIAARAIGVTTDELNKLLKRGEIDSKRFISAFGRELQATFGSGARRQMFSLTASINRLKTAIFEIGITFAQKVKPAITEVIIELTAFIKKLAASKEFQVFVTFVRDQFRQLAATLPQILSGIVSLVREVGPAFRTLAKAVLVINSAAIGTIVAGLRRAIPLMQMLGDEASAVIQRLSGLDISKLNISLASMRAAFESGRIMVDILFARLKELPERLTAFFVGFNFTKFTASIVQFSHLVGTLFAFKFVMTVRDRIRDLLSGNLVARDLENIGKSMVENFTESFSEGFTYMTSVATSQTATIRSLFDDLGETVSTVFSESNTSGLTLSLKSIARQVGTIETSLIKTLARAASFRNPFSDSRTTDKFGDKKAADEGKSQIVRLEDIRERIEDALLSREKDKAVVDNTTATRENTRVMSQFLQRTAQATGLNGVADAVGNVAKRFALALPGGAQ